MRGPLGLFWTWVLPGPSHFRKRTPFYGAYLLWSWVLGSTYSSKVYMWLHAPERFLGKKHVASWQVTDQSSGHGSPIYSLCDCVTLGIVDPSLGHLSRLVNSEARLPYMKKTHDSKGHIGCRFHFHSFLIWFFYIGLWPHRWEKGQRNGGDLPHRSPRS